MLEDLFSFPQSPPGCTGMRWSCINYPGEDPIVSITWYNDAGTAVKCTSIKVDVHDVAASRAWIIDGLVQQTARIIKAKTIPKY